jgi:hypothetical protein
MWTLAWRIEWFYVCNHPASSSRFRWTNLICLTSDSLFCPLNPFQCIYNRLIDHICVFEFNSYTFHIEVGFCLGFNFLSETHSCRIQYNVALLNYSVFKILWYIEIIGLNPSKTVFKIIHKSCYLNRKGIKKAVNAV